MVINKIILICKGDQPENFYLIMKGGVHVLVPKDKENLKKEREFSNQAMISKFTQYLNTNRLQASSIKVATNYSNKSETTEQDDQQLPKTRSETVFQPPTRKLERKTTKDFNRTTGNLNIKDLLSTEILPNMRLDELHRMWMFFEDGIFKYYSIAVLGQYQSFGDLGLLMKKPRAATILCAEDSHFLLEMNYNLFVIF